MRLINHLVFLGALLGGVVFAAVNWRWLWTFTHVNFYFGTAPVPLNLIVLASCLGVIFLQWLVVQGAWIFRHKKLDRAENEITRLKARLYDLTEGSLLDDIKTSITEARKELRDDIKWLATQPYYNTAAQLTEGQRERRETPPLLREGGE